jgi:4-alpha-glucanotransferase
MTKVTLDSADQVSLSPFPPGYRGSGILMHVTSLPSPHGIGDVGPVAVAWVDRLHKAHQSWWQVLPLNPTGYGDSPYYCLSSFAGNELLVSPDWLLEEGLLSLGDCQHPPFPDTSVDYVAVTAYKHRLLDRAWTNFTAGSPPELRLAYEQFCHRHAPWLEDYALFRALRTRYGGAHLVDWPGELVRREATALAQVRGELARPIDRFRFAQFLLFRQCERLREYAHARGVYLIGDLPFFVSPDSSDVWTHPELFLLDNECRPRFVAGVPPDYFSSHGQLWGNPVYDWDELRRTGYRWCIDRFRALLAQVDLIRLDHFRGFAAAWHVPAGAATAENGEWVPGPGAEFFKAVYRELGVLPFIAEDLGVITPDVCELLDQFQLPGTRVLQFAFDSESDNPHLPHNYTPNTVVYTGTHDNTTTRAWFRALPRNQRLKVREYLKGHGSKSIDVVRESIRSLWSSAAALAVVPLQDVLNLGSEARMNLPGTAEGNWRWRSTEEMLSLQPFRWFRRLTETSNRGSAGR